MIAIYTETLPEAFRWTPDYWLGGTPEWYVNTAETLVTMGYEVQVFYDGEPCEKNGVYYLPRELYEPADILICNERPPRMSKRNIYWTAFFNDRAKDFMDFDHRITLSKYHKSIFGDSTIIGLGIHPELYTGGKKENICLYSSSPDRGGEFLDTLADDIEKEGYKLVKTYSKSISEAEMVELYNKSKFWLHPCQGIELFCVAAVKAQASGCIPVVVPNMALDETVKIGIKTDLEHYREELIKALKNPPRVEPYQPPTWKEVTSRLVELF